MRSIARVDSCATADHPMIDHIWRERLALADLLVRVGPDGGATVRSRADAGNAAPLRHRRRESVRAM